MRTPQTRKRGRITASLANLDKFPVLPWISAKSGVLRGLARDLDLEVVKVSKGEGA